jgi:phosphatidylserine/phosphatidylglycerophosphate/cardiolipin synthase-like enzyme
MSSPPVQAPARRAQTASTGPEAATPVAFDWRILKPGHNCWRVAEAGRAALLVDAAEYYHNLYQALMQAQRSIIIVGWDFDGRMTLCPDGGPERSRALGPLLRSLVEERPALEVRILVWSHAVVIAHSDPKALLLGDAWQEHPRIHLRLDTRHPINASHHQKIVVIDDAVAFTGGIDLTIRRWDTSSHQARHDCRTAPDGISYGPVHDLQMAVDGEAARAVCDHARWRWQTAVGEALAPLEPSSRCWPDDLESDFTNVPIAIARTAPDWRRTGPIREVANLVTEGIAAAEHTIYIETQYLSSVLVSNALAERLSQRDGPEIVLVISPFSKGVFERYVFGNNRDRIIRKLSRLPGANRLRFYYPVVPGPDGDCPVLVHAKLLIIDDVLLRVGSGNATNRSMGLDTEFDLAIEATDEGMKRTIAGVRSRLLAEHLDATPEEIADATAAKGSLIAAIEAHNPSSRGLRQFDPGTGPTRPVLGSAIIDASGPWDPLWFLRRIPTRTAGTGS